MYLTGAVEYSVQIGRARSGSFEWLLLLTGLGASESGVDCRILIAIAVNAAFVFVSTLMSIPSGLAVAVSGFTSARFAYIVIATG